MEYLTELWNSIIGNEFMIIFLIAAIGYLIGAIKIKGIEVGTAGVLLVALVFGHFMSTGMEGEAYESMIDKLGVIGDMGLILFVTSVGFIAGPKFFRNFKINATSYVLLGVIIILAGAATTVGVITLAGINTDIAVGMMSGALTSTPGLAAAKEVAQNPSLASIGYGIAYPFGVIGVVLFVQLMPKILRVDIAKEREQFEAAAAVELKESKRKYFKLDPFGFFSLALAIVLGIIIAKITIPLPGGGKFALGTSGGPLIAGLILGHFGHVGPISLKVEKNVLECMRELGLFLFLLGAGTEAGGGFIEQLAEHGIMLFVYGAIITIVPMIIGYIIASKVLKLSIFNTLGSICGGMTSTPALGTLISVTGTDDVASAYAATYPFALVCVILASQFIGILL